MTLASAYARWRNTALGQITERLECDLVLELAGPITGKRILDAGSGDGTFALQAARRGANVLGIDLDPAMVAAAHRRADDAGLALDLVQGSITALPVRDASVDVALAVTVLCLVDDPSAAVRELARVLAPGGRLVLGELASWSTWAAVRTLRGWLRDPTWSRARFWTRRQLAGLVESAGLRVVEVRGAVHYPKLDLAARAFARVDPLLGRLHAPGAAFLALVAEKPAHG